MVLGDGDWARDRESSRSTTAVLEKLGNDCIECVSCSQTVIALRSGDAVRSTLCRSSGGCVANTAYLARLRDGQFERLCEVIAQQQYGNRRDPLQAN